MLVLEPVVPSGHHDGLGLAQLHLELQRRWCADTSFWPDEWTPDRPSHGQCAVTALLVHDRFGGELLRTVNQGVPHYWNQLSSVEVDLTRDQFEVWAPEQPVTSVGRDDLVTSGPTLAARYRQLVDSLGS